MAPDPTASTRLGARAAATLACLCLLASCAEPRRGRVIDRWEVASPVFRVRVTIHAEGNRHQYYRRGRHNVIEWAPVGSDYWREFAGEYMTEPQELPRDNVRFVNDSTAYVFWHDWFVVTVNGGKQWSRWKLTYEQLGGLGHGPERTRQEVRVGPDGKGVMLLHLITRRGEGPAAPKTFELHTTDYGQHWQIVREL